MAHENINVEGMTCGHCVETVTQAVQSLKGISTVEINLENKQVSVDFDETQTDLGAIASKITGVGFEVVSK